MASFSKASDRVAFVTRVASVLSARRAAILGAALFPGVPLVATAWRLGFASTALLCLLWVACRVLRQCGPPQLVHAAESSLAADVLSRCAAVRDGRWWFPTPYLFNGDLQSCFYAWSTEGTSVPMRREPLAMADGGTVSLDWADTAAAAALPVEAPIAILMHGVGGSSRGLGHVMLAALRLGLRPVAFNRRGATGALTSACFNLFGDTRDLHAVVERCARLYPAARIGLWGASAGSALCVRYLGDRGDATRVGAGVAVSPGYDIAVCCARCSAAYDSFYLHKLKETFLRRNAARLQARDAAAYARGLAAPNAHRLMEAVAPFAAPDGAPPCDVAAFLARSNPMAAAEGVRRPCLCINSRDDPIATVDNALEHLALFRRSRFLALALAPFGGHCGFYRGCLRPRNASDELGMQFLAAALSDAAVEACRRSQPGSQGAAPDEPAAAARRGGKERAAAGEGVAQRKGRSARSPGR